MIDTDALQAAVELVHRSGGRQFEIGYLYDDETPPPGWPEGQPVPPHAAAWYATVTYAGAKLMVEHYPEPLAAAEALARRILAGATCARCRLPIVVGGSKRSRRACTWTRVGPHYRRGCDGGHGDSDRPAS